MSTITEKLNTVETSVSDIKQAIVNKGGTISGNITTYASAITNLPSGSSDSIENKNPDGISPLYIWNGTQEEWNDSGVSKDWYNWKSEGEIASSWQSVTLPLNKYWSNIVFGNNKFVAVSFSQYFVYSTDGITWTQGTMPSDGTWYALSFCNDKFIASRASSNIFAYSYDGINWTSKTLPLASTWQSVMYGNGRFVTIAAAVMTTLYLPYASFSCYTDTTTPTTESTVYDSPNEESSLSITSVGESSITLSDTNTYDRNSSGDTTTTNNVGQEHPDYICYINDTGIKVADKFIAKKK